MHTYKTNVFPNVHYTFNILSLISIIQEIFSEKHDLQTELFFLFYVAGGGVEVR